MLKTLCPQQKPDRLKPCPATTPQPMSAPKTAWTCHRRFQSAHLQQFLRRFLMMLTRTIVSLGCFGIVLPLIVGCGYKKHVLQQQSSLSAASNIRSMSKLAGQLEQHLRRHTTVSEADNAVYHISVAETTFFVPYQVHCYVIGADGEIIDDAPLNPKRRMFIDPPVSKESRATVLELPRYMSQGQILLELRGFPENRVQDLWNPQEARKQRCGIVLATYRLNLSNR
jgi:hypothetical protein